MLLSLDKYNAGNNEQHSFGEYLDAHISLYFKDKTQDEFLGLSDKDKEIVAQEITGKIVSDEYNGIELPDGRFLPKASLVNKIEDRISNHYQR